MSHFNLTNAKGVRSAITSVYEIFTDGERQVKAEREAK